MVYSCKWQNQEPFLFCERKTKNTFYHWALCTLFVPSHIRCDYLFPRNMPSTLKDAFFLSRCCGCGEWLTQWHGATGESFLLPGSWVMPELPLLFIGGAPHWFTYHWLINKESNECWWHLPFISQSQRTPYLSPICLLSHFWEGSLTRTYS